MTEQRDIIGVVKELQKAYDRLESFGEGDTEKLDVKLWHHFPAIADALLIAVDALEAARERLGCLDDGVEEDGPADIEISAGWKICDDALSRISSLKSQ